LIGDFHVLLNELKIELLLVELLPIVKEDIILPLLLVNELTVERFSQSF
jgi:hypothetical protein